MLQIALGWTDSHLHHFLIGPTSRDWQTAPFLTPYDIAEGDHGIPEADVRLDQVLHNPGDQLFYTYDFGDNWQHTLRLETIQPWVDHDPVAVCLDGRRACPPEDVGGIPGYHDMLATLAGHPTPDTEDHPDWADQLRAWLPPGYDPDVFTADQVNQQLQIGTHQT
ncbi:MAG: plasmid pRiA4b ORF-3 family protein [Micropruina sp.]|nr:plasmid pRiA4b ORF-3 family protein [Micropruina sp.]